MSKFWSTAVVFVWNFYCVSTQASSDSRCPQYSRTYRMTTFRDKCLQFSYDSVEWKSARSYCWQKGGRLVKVNDPEMSTYLSNTLNGLSWGTEEVWTGLNKLDSRRWTWLGNFRDSAEPLTWTNWASNYPTTSWLWSLECVYLKRDGGLWKWKNAHCNNRGNRHRFICEYQQLPEPVVTNPPPCPEQEFTSSRTTKARQTVDSEVTSTKSPQTTMKYTTLLDTVVDEAGEDGKASATIHLIKKATDIPKFANRMERPDNVKTRKSLIGQVDNENEVYTNSQYLANQSGKMSNIPPYTMIMAFVGGICIAGLLAAFLIVCRRRRKKNDPVSEMYITTGYLKNAGAEALLSPWQLEKGAHASSCSTLKNNERAVANDYMQDHDVSTKESTEDTKVNRFLTNPTVASITRGKLPEVPTDGGYEIPVKLVVALPPSTEQRLEEQPQSDDEPSKICEPKEVYHEIPADLKPQTKENDYYIANDHNQ